MRRISPAGFLPPKQTATAAARDAAGPRLLPPGPAALTVALALGLLGPLALGSACGDDDGGNTPPEARAGADQVGVVGLEVRLDGSGSQDPDGDPITYAWSMVSTPAGSQATLHGADTVSATFLPDLPGRYEVQLVVSDGVDVSAPDTVAIDVSDASDGTGWSATYGQAGAEEMEGIVALPDGGFLACGLTSSYSGDDTGDALLVRLSPDGQVLWARTYGGPDDDMCIDVKRAAGGGIWLAGWTRSFGAGGHDAWILKLNDAGEVLWGRAYGGPGDEQAWSLQETADGGAVFAGGTTSFGAGQADIWVVRIDASGSPLWQRAYGGADEDAPGAPFDEYVARVVATADDQIVAAAPTFSFGDGGDVWILKLDFTNGDVLWEQAFGGPDEDSNWSVSAMPDGGVAFTGAFIRDPNDWDPDLWVVRLGADGGVLWQRRYGQAGRFDEALNQAPTADGGLVIAAYAEYESSTDWRSALLRLGADGSLTWAREFDVGAMSWPNAVVELADGFAAVGVTAADVQTWDEQMWVLRTDANGQAGDGCPLGTPLSLDVADTGAAVTQTQATVTDTAATVTDTAVTPQDVPLVAAYDCR